MDDTNDILDQIYRPVISKVKEFFDKQMFLSHSDYEAEKQIFTIEGKNKFIEHWSKKWPNDVTKYTDKEKCSLATREVVKHFATLLQIASRTFIFTNSHSFTQVANYLEMRSLKIAHYLLITYTYLITFQTKPNDDFQLLNEQVPDDEFLKKVSQLSIAPLARFFRVSAKEVMKIPIVRTDGSFRKSVIQGGISAIEVFWNENSSFNVSRWATYPLFINQRVELEAILCALEQAYQRKLPRLILYSDSTYALGLFNSFST